MFPDISTRFLIIFLLILVLVPQLHSQDNLEDVVYLKNGTFLRGSITRLVPGKSLKIFLTGKDTLEIQMSDVREIKRESTPEKNVFISDAKEWGYTNITEVSIGFGNSEGLDRKLDQHRKQLSVMISTVNGITITSYIQVGIGIGMEFWENRGFIPVYLDFRANMLKSLGTPFFYINVGYAPGWMEDVSGMGVGGAMMGIGTGARFRVNNKLAMTFGVGYRFQQIRQCIEMNRVSSKATLDANFFVLRSGIFF